MLRGWCQVFSRSVDGETHIAFYQSSAASHEKKFLRNPLLCCIDMDFERAAQKPVGDLVSGYLGSESKRQRKCLLSCPHSRYSQPDSSCSLSLWCYVRRRSACAVGMVFWRTRADAVWKTSRGEHFTRLQSRKSTSSISICANWSVNGSRVHTSLQNS